MACRSFLGLCLALACGLTPATAEEQLVLVPRESPAGKPFSVALPVEMLEAGLRSPDSGIKYHWKVIDVATGNPFLVDAGIEGLAEGKIVTSRPILPVKTPLKAKYRFEVRRSDVDDETPATVTLVDATGEFTQLAAPVEREPVEGTTGAAARPMPNGAASGAVGNAAATAGAGEKWPEPFEVEPGSTQEAIAERLGDARAWWNANVIKEFKTKPIVDEVFIRLKLTEDRESDFNLKDQIQTPLIAAARFYRAAYAAAEADKDGKAEEVWKTQRERLLKEIDADDQETSLVLQLIRNFLDDLEAEIKSKTMGQPNKFGFALREAAMIIGKLLLKKVNDDIANLGAGPSGDGRSRVEGTTFSGGDGFYGTSHAAVHHARAMSRIRMRSTRRMARIQSFQ